MTRKVYIKREAAEYMKKAEMAPEERQMLLSWVKEGNSVYANPRLLSDDRGRPMDFITALRIEDDDMIFGHGDVDANETVGDDEIF